MLRLARHNGRALEYAHSRLRADRKFMLEAMAQDLGALEYASDELMLDRSFVLDCIQCNPQARTHACTR